MEKQYLDLMQMFEGYVRNYRRLNLSQIHNRSMFTKREIDFFAGLGESFGYHVFIEDSKVNKLTGKSRPMDLAWWKTDERVDPDNYLHLTLHLERESLPNKDIDTIEKLFAETEEGFTPHNVIGIQYIESEAKISALNELVFQKNQTQQSNAIMIYRFYDHKLDLQRVWAYFFTPNGLKETRQAVANIDDSNYWYVCFDEEYVPFVEQKEEVGSAL